MSIREVLPFADPDWRLEPLPSRVERSEPDWDFQAPEGSSVALLLVDEQQHIASRTISNRVVRRLLHPAALKTFRQVEIAFDAQSRRLRIHELVIWRQDESGTWQGTSVAERVDFIVRQPTRAHERVSLIAELDGIEVGDAVDLSWTLEPLDSAPELPFSSVHPFVWNVPCGVTHFTILADRDAPLQWKLHCLPGIDRPEHVSAHGRHHWRQWHPPVTRLEPHAPPGVWNFPVLEASCWADWAEVAETIHAFWAIALAEIGRAHV